MIACPKCNASLPDWTQTCQFCQTDVKSVARPKIVAVQKKGYTPMHAWVWPAYYAMCAFFIIEGAGGILETIISSHQKFLGQEMGLGAFSFISMAFDGFTILLGVGLALRVELIRRIVNFFCGLRIFFGLLGLAGSLLGSLIAGPMALIFIFLNVVNIVTAGFMIYLIGETDRFAPNL